MRFLIQKQTPWLRLFLYLGLSSTEATRTDWGEMEGNGKGEMREIEREMDPVWVKWEIPEFGGSAQFKMSGRVTLEVTPTAQSLHPNPRLFEGKFWRSLWSLATSSGTWAPNPISNLDILNLMERTPPPSTHCANFGGSFPKSLGQCIFASLWLISLKRCCLRIRLQVLNMKSRNIPYQIFFCFIHMIETPAMVLANPRKCVYSLIKWKELDSHVAVQGIFWGFYQTQQPWQHKGTLISASNAVSH